jgi:hypothetical protein
VKGRPIEVEQRGKKNEDDEGGTEGQWSQWNKAAS